MEGEGEYAVSSRLSKIGRIVRDRRSKWAIAFAVGSVAILLGAMAAQVQNERNNYAHKTAPGPAVREVDLDFVAVAGSKQTDALYAVGPLGQIDLGRSPADGLITYRAGGAFVKLTPAGSTYSGLSWWRGGVGGQAPTADGVHARYESLFPSTSADIVSGIDGVEYTLEIRSRPFVGRGDMTYDFWMDLSDGLAPAGWKGPLLSTDTPRVLVGGAFPIKDGLGRTIFEVTPAKALVERRPTPVPVLDRSVSAVELPGLGRPAPDVGQVPLDYVLSRVGGRYLVSVVVPIEVLSDPAVVWPVRVDPGITNPIANSSYFADQTIIMDSDLVVTSSGAAQFSNVTLIMNRTSAPNYNISTSAGGRMTWLSSTIKANDSALPYKFTVNGTFTAQDTLIKHTNDGLQLLGNTSTLSNVTLQNGTGRGLVIIGGNASLARVEVPSPAGTGLFAQNATIATQFVNVTGAGGEGLYLNSTSGSVSWSHIRNSTLNGAMVVNGSSINLTHSEFSGSKRNGVIVIGGAPSLENSSVTLNNWSGVALFDDHSAYLYGNLIAGNNWSGVETRLNSTADLYVNTIQGNGKAGVRVIASDPNIERNTVTGNDIGVWLEGAHNPGAKPGATSATEGGYSYLMAASLDLQDGGLVPLVAGVSLTHQGASTQAAVPAATKSFPLTVTNTDNGGGNKVIQLSIDDDQPAWASLSTVSVTLGPGASATVTLTVTVPSNAQKGTTYDVKVWANETAAPQPKTSVWAYVDLQYATTLSVADISTGNQTTVMLTAVLMAIGAGPVSGKTVAFKLDGHWGGEATTNSGGFAALQYTVSQPPLSQALLAYFNGTQYYAASSGSGYVNISWKDSYLQNGTYNGRWGDSTELRVRLLTTPGDAPAAARPVYFSLDGTYIGRAYTDVQGNATLVFNDTLEPGTYSWNASFDGDPYTGNSNNSSSFESLKDLTLIDGPSFTIRQGENAAHTMRLTDDEGNPLGSRTLHVKRGSNTLADVSTDAEGWTSYSDTGAAGLAEGDYSMTYVFDAEAHFNGITQYFTLTVRKWATSFNASNQSEYYGDGGTLMARLLDEDGNGLASRSVDVYLGATHLGTVTTNATGWALYSDATVRVPHAYSLRFSFDTDTRDLAATKTVTLTVLREITQFLVVVDARIGAGDVLVVHLRLTDDDGVGISKFVRVTLLGGDYANGTTNATGYLNVSFDARGLIPERYTLFYLFDGDINYSGTQAYTRIVVEFDADLYANDIEGNHAGVRANNSSSKLVGNRIASNLDNVFVTNGSLLIFNGSVGLSMSADYRIGEGGSIYSTNTTFNRGKVALDAGAVLLHVRWLLNIHLLYVGSQTPANGVVITLRNVAGDMVLNKTTNATGWFGEEAVTEYTQNSSGRAMKTAHVLTVGGFDLTLTMDVTRNMTLFRGDDTDGDGIPNRLEDAGDVYIVEAEAHALEFTQITQTNMASGGRAVASLPSDTRFLDPASYPVFQAGFYSFMVRARGATTSGKLRAVVKSEANATLLNETFIPSGEFRWYSSFNFEIASAQTVFINVTDESANPATAALELDEVALVRMLLSNGTVAHRPGQVTSALQPDMDFDTALDGGEVRNGTYWMEAENVNNAVAGDVRSNWNASNSWERGHPAGNVTVLTLNQTFVDQAGVYALWIRARGNGTDGALQVNQSVDGVLVASTNLSFPASEFGLLSVRFEFVVGHNTTLALYDRSDTSGGATQPGLWVDKLALVLELSRPYVKAYSPMADPATLPVEGTTFAYVGKESGFLEALYWVANSTLYMTPLWSVYVNTTVIPTWSYAVGANPTQPIVFTLKDGTQMLATTGGDFVYAFRLPIDPVPMKYNMSLVFGGTVTLNGLAEMDGWLVGTTTSGKIFGLEVKAQALELRWIFDPAMGASHAVGSIYHDKAYFGFDLGLVSIAYNTTHPAAEAWRLGVLQWPHPLSRCPPINISECVPYMGIGAVNRTVAGAPLFDLGNIFVLAYNNSDVDLYRLTEDGQTIWAISLNITPPVMGLSWAAPQLALRYGTVAVLGNSIKVFDRQTGQLMVGHDFNYTITGNFSASPIFTDRELIAPGPDGIYFFGYPTPQAFGDAFARDGNHTFGALLAEDTVWKVNETALVNRQPILGDFDGSGYRDLMYANATGFVFVKDFEVGYRSYTEYNQLGRDAAHGANAEYLFSYTPTDPLDPDSDFDNASDGQEITSFYGYAQTEAEDALSFHAWADSAANGSAKNFNFFHQTGVTLTTDDGNVSFGPDQRMSWVRVPVSVGQTGTYKVTLVPNLEVKEVVDLVYAQANASTPGSVNTTVGYGVGVSADNRSYAPAAIPLDLTAGQRERVRQMFENATYLKVRYASFYSGDTTDFTMARHAEVTVYSATYDPMSRAKIRLVVFVTMDFQMELYGPMNYVFEVGLNMSLVPTSGLGGDALGAGVSLMRILDIDKIHIEKRGLTPFTSDTDGDGTLDGDEAAWYPWTADVDQDGLSDVAEIRTYHTNPGDRDSDHDGIRDRVELGLGQGDTDPLTIYDTTASWAGYPEWQASQFRGDPHFRPPSVGRVLPNWDADPSTHTDPNDPDTDGDGIPDGWVDGWVYDPSGIPTEIRQAAASNQEYLTRAQPVEYDVKNWHQSGIFDNYAEIWEGEDANLDGAAQGNQASGNPNDHWSFWESTLDPAGSPRDATKLSFIRKGAGESDASKADTDGDGLPEGFEVFYATRAPILKDPAVPESYFFTPITDDGGLDEDPAYLPAPINEAPQSSPSSQLIVYTSMDLATGIQIPTPSVDQTLPRLVSQIALFLNGTVNGTSVTIEVWQSNDTTEAPQTAMAASSALMTNVSGWVNFTLPALWMNFSTNRFYVVLKDASSNVTWWNNDTSGDKKWYKQNETGVWSNTSLTNKHPSIRVYDLFTTTGDGLNNTEEFLVGTNPKARDTDANTAGPLSRMGDLLPDGTEVKDHVIFRTNAYHGALNRLHYGDGTWILVDSSIESSADSDWMYFSFVERVENPNETFGGAKNRSSYLYTLPDGAEFHVNVSGGRLYLYFPGADFENIEEEQNLSNVTHFYNGTALVFQQGNASAVSADYRTNKILPVSGDKWLFWLKQLYASDPFDWDTDNDGIADGWEVDGFKDSDGDWVPNVRDMDSDNDGLTDGQEMLQARSNWHGEADSGANLLFDPDGDGKYAMIDIDSDGDGIPDAQEVLWSVDSDHDGLINLVDEDSDGDGLCDGWCTSSSVAAWRVAAPPGVASPNLIPNGEDTSHDGVNDQNESSPIKSDTDGDGLRDGYSRLWNASSSHYEWFLAGIDSQRCPATANVDAFCGENATYSLYINATAWTSPTNRTNPDTDGDGISDRVEVNGSSITVMLTGGTRQVNRTMSSPNLADTDGDGIADPREANLGSNATNNDTDGDGLLDGTEDANRDGVREANETSAVFQDTDADGLADGTEDVDHDGVKDTLEPSPLLPDTDADGLPDAEELALLQSNDSSWTITHDYDGDGASDLNDKDSDNDGLDDGVEDWNRSNLIDRQNESNPYNNDTDWDGVLDGAEPSPFADSDRDGKINVNDTDSNADSTTDKNQVYVVFRTNATGGQYGAGTWVALIAPGVNPNYPSRLDFGAASALYTYVETTGAPDGAGQVENPYGLDSPPPADVSAASTPEGYRVLIKLNGSFYDVFIEVSESHYAKYVKSSTPPSDYSTSNKPVEAFLVHHQETYDGRVALAKDTDWDGLSPAEEAACGINASNNDTDGDGILDGIEFRNCADTDHDGHVDANDSDKDNDGIADGLEDKNHNGNLDAGETNAMRTDSDLDGLSDGDEDANHDGVRQSSETSPLLADTDGDWIGDYDEVHGTWCYNGETASCGSPNGARVTDATTVDTDDDGIPDGLETGAPMARSLNDLTVGYSWRGPESQTNPVDDDTDSDGLADGLEDANRDGRREQNETSAEFADTDADGLCDGSCSGHGEDLNLDGVRNQDDDGNWTETDSLASDSDVDGISDGAEVFGSWCNATETSAQCSGAPNAARVLLPLNPDTDGDGLRDGQETAGWKVAVWREITMEIIANYSVTSDPLSQNTDGDQNSDFTEFQNGSDPWKADTDGDGRNDTLESTLGENVTGFYMLPPQFMNLFLSADGKWTGLGVEKVCRGGGLLGVGCTTYAKVSFQVWSWWGVGFWEINYGAPELNEQEESEIENITGFQGSIAKLFCDNSDSRKSIGDEKCDRVAELWGNARVVGRSFVGNGAGQNVVNASAEFVMTSNEDHVNGPWVQARVFDIYGAGTQKTVKLKSTLEHILDFLAAVAKAIAEAASFLVRVLLGAISYIMDLILSPIRAAVDSFQRSAGGALNGVLGEAGVNASRLLPMQTVAQKELVERMMVFLTVLQMIVLILTVVGIIADLIVTIASGGATEFILQFVLSFVVAVAVTMIFGAVLENVQPGPDVIVDGLAAGLPGGVAELENHVAARDIIISLIGILWDVVMKVVDRLGNKDVAKTRGFTITLFGLFLAAFGYEFEATQPGQISIIAGVFALVGLILTSLGFFYFLKEEAKDLKEKPGLMYYVKVGIEIGAAIAAAGAVIAAAPAAFNCIWSPRTPC